jgi:hypothetical protein
MKTILDTSDSWRWFPLTAEYKDRELKLILEEGAIQGQTISVEITSGIVLENLKPIEVISNSRKILIHFTDVKFIQIFDEVAHLANLTESRDLGIVAQHHNSELIRWIGKSTKLSEITPGELFHYSVETAEDFYHVITREHPTVREFDV